MIAFIAGMRSARRVTVLVAVADCRLWPRRVKMPK